MISRGTIEYRRGEGQDGVRKRAGSSRFRPCSSRDAVSDSGSDD